MARPGRKPKAESEAHALAEAQQQRRALRERAAEEVRHAVSRLVRAGLSDNQVAERLGIGAKRAAALREAACLPANPRGGLLD